MADDDLQDDEKILIIAAAVLATILLSLMCFAALYRSFLGQYASAYDNQVKMLNPFQTGGIPSPQPTSGGATSESPGPVTIKLNSSPATEPSKKITSNMTTNAVAETSFPSAVPADTTPAPQQAWASASPSPDQSAVWNSNSGDENEFFSAAEQAKIWAELREAEVNASQTASSVDAAKAAAASAMERASPAAKSAPAAEYVEMFSETAGQTSIATVGSQEPVAIADDDDNDENTKFGFDEADLGQDEYIEPATTTPVQQADYIDPNSLQNAGPTSVNADNEWWR